MNHDQFLTILSLIDEARMNAGGQLAVAKTDWEKEWANKLMAAANAAKPALDAAWEQSRMLRGQAPCPECGEYFDIYEQKEVA